METWVPCRVPGPVDTAWPGTIWKCGLEGKGDAQPVCENHQGYSDIPGWSVEGACDTLRRLESSFIYLRDCGSLSL